MEAWDRAKRGLRDDSALTPLTCGESRHKYLLGQVIHRYSETKMHGPRCNAAYGGFCSAAGFQVLTVA